MESAARRPHPSARPQLQGKGESTGFPPLSQRESERGGAATRQVLDLELLVQDKNFHGLPLDTVKVHGFCRRWGIQDLHERI